MLRSQQPTPAQNCLTARPRLLQEAAQPAARDPRANQLPLRPPGPRRTRTGGAAPKAEGGSSTHGPAPTAPHPRHAAYTSVLRRSSNTFLLNPVLKGQMRNVTPQPRPEGRVDGRKEDSTNKSKCGRRRPRAPPSQRPGLGGPPGHHPAGQHPAAQPGARGGTGQPAGLRGARTHRRQQAGGEDGTSHALRAPATPRALGERAGRPIKYPPAPPRPARGT